VKALAPPAPPLTGNGTTIRLGLVWAAVVVVSTAIGPRVVAVVFAVVALGAAGQCCRSWKRHSRRPFRPVAIGGAVVMTLAASAGPLATTAAAVGAGATAVVAARLRAGDADWDASLTAAIALIVGVAAGSVPLVRSELGLTPALVFVAMVLTAEASWFLIGTGARTQFEAPAAATAAAAAVALAAAAVFVPPFRGASPWMLAAVVAVLVPLGPRVASAVLARPTAVAPALRRIDGFALAGPVWALVASAMLDL
jgi:hypothetical protein